jgi:hypothetical protein
MGGGERIEKRHEKGGGMVSRHEAYEAPKIDFGAVSRRSTGKQRCAGARARPQQKSARAIECAC